MIDFIKNITQQFDAFLNKINEMHSGNLVSFMWKNNDDYNINPNDGKKYFNLNKPEAKFSIKAIGEVLELADTHNSYSSLNEQIQNLKNKSFNNFSDLSYPHPPLFMSYRKFDSEKQSETWNAFKSFTFFIPELILINNSSANYIIFNFILNNPQNKIIAKQELTEWMKKISKDSLINNSIISSQTAEVHNEILHWKELVKDAVNHLSNGKLNKIVLSRFKKLIILQKPNWNELVAHLSKEFPQCYKRFITPAFNFLQ
ncbi:MAG: hypothetical protein R3321_09785 [Nitrososphaeraceae archaeon]|nr:hypothetical protein [Nitrososphaeraceae archaeon]